MIRTISALVLGVVALVLTWVGGTPFRLLTVVGAAIIFYEWMVMTRLPASRSIVPGAALAVVLVALASGAAARLVLELLAGGVALSLVAGWILDRRAIAAAGLAYAGLSGYALAFLRADDPAGLKAVLFLFAVVWMTDIAAYFVGRTLGGPKLAPGISPGKTWSGAIGGAVLGGLAGLVAALGAGLRFDLVLVVAVLVLSIVSQLGDLFESAVKRRFGAKDSSHIIPGHGGVMDRVDGLVAAGFALYLIGALIAGLDQPAHGLFALR